jgi:hypothetical protein
LASQRSFNIERKFAGMVVEMNRLEGSIQRLYLAFSRVSRPRHIDGCPCCIDGNNIERLLKTSLAEVSAEDLSPYASSAFLTVGATADYLYFLPRILELTARGELLWPDPEVTGRAIASARGVDGLSRRRDRIGHQERSIS